MSSEEIAMKLRAKSFTGVRSVVAGVAALFLFLVPAVAHHSFAMFDFTKTLELTGTVKEFQWTNPHSSLQIVVNDARGAASDWTFEMGCPACLARQGFKPKTLLPGDKVTVWMHPLKDGAQGGAFLQILLPDGRKLGETQ
jgi:hypothetical protein